MKRFAGIGGLVLAVLLTAATAWAQDAGQFTELQGRVTVKKANGQSAQAVLGSKVVQGDVVTTDLDSKGTILFQNGSVVRLGPSTTLTINQLVYDQDKGVAKSAYDLASGVLMNVVGSIFGGDDSEYVVNTPTSVSGVRGTINILKVGIHPRTGRLTTMGVSLQGTTWLRGNGEKGDGCVLPPGTYGLVDDSTGMCQFQGAISDEDLQALLNAFDLRDPSVNQRSQGMRGGSGQSPFGGGDRWYAPPDFLEPMGGPGGHGGDDPEDWWLLLDNPSNFIFQEPPQFTELIITIQGIP